MTIPYKGQLRYAGVHERDAYGPTDLVTGAATLALGATTDTGVDWSNVLVASQAATGENAYRDYGLAIMEHGSNPVSTPPAIQQHRGTLRVKYRVRIRPPGGGLAAGQGHFLAALLDDGGTIQAKIGVYNNAGTVVFKLQDQANGASYLGTRAVSYGTWYELDLEYSKQARLGLYSRATGEAGWTTEVSQALSASSTLGDVHTLRLGSLGGAGTSTGAWAVEYHSLAWEFEEKRRAAWMQASTSQSLRAPSTPALQTGDVDFWVGGWVYLQTLSSLQVVFSKWDSGTNEREWQILYVPGTGTWRFAVSTDGTDSVTVDSASAVAAKTWYFLFAWRSKTDGKLYLSVGAGAPASAAFAGVPRAGTTELRAGASLSSGAVASPLDGRLNFWAFGKLAANSLTEASGLAVSIRDTLYNGGAAVDSLDLSDAFRAESGIISFWRLDEDEGQDRLDQIGSNPLLDVGGVPVIPGFASVLTPTAAGVRAAVEDFVGCRIADHGPTQAAPRLLWRAGHWRAVTHARITYGTNPSLSGATAGPWTAVSAATAATAYLLELPTVTGLAANTRYYYRWELSRDGSTAHVQSDIRQFRTLPDTDTAPLVEHVWSCHAQWRSLLPDRELGTMLDTLETEGAVLHRSFCLGDMFYEWAEEPNTSAGARTVDDYVREILEALYDPYMARLIRSTATPWMPSDHELFNGGDSRPLFDAGVRATAMSALTTNTGGAPQATYPAGTTAGEVADAAKLVMDYWYRRPWLTTPASGTAYPGASGVRVMGSLMECRLDLRHTDRDNTGYSTGNATLLGSGAGSLRAWFDGVVADFASHPTARLLVVYMDAPLTPINAHPLDSWALVARAESQAVIDMIADTVVDPAKGVVFMTGDKHSVFWSDRYFLGASGVRAGALKLHSCASGMGSSYWRGDGNQDPIAGPGAAYVEHYWPGQKRGMPAGTGSTGRVKSSGVVQTIDLGAGTVSQRYWTDYGRLYQPASLQNYTILGASGGGGGATINGALTLQGGGAATSGTVYAARLSTDQIEAQAAVGAGGAFTLTGLVAGQSYRVWAETPVGGATYTTQVRILTAA